MRSSGKNGGIVVFTLLVLALGLRGPAATLTVDDDAPADFSTIQAAVDTAADGDTILVQPGTYTGDGNRDISFKGKAITVRGVDPNDASIVARTVIKCQGTEESPHRGFQFISGEGSASVLAGLKITNGYGPTVRSGYSDHSVGGAILCLRSGPTIRNCQIIGNAATWNGGGICCVEAATVLTANTIAGNTTSFYGGGISCEGGDVTIDRCVFRSNTSGSSGGAVYLKAVKATLDNCLLATNLSQVRGGAVFCEKGVTLAMANCTVVDNIAGGYVGEGAGGIDPYYPHLQNVVTLTSCIVWNNCTAGKCSRLTQTSKYPVTVLHSCILGCAGDAEENGNTGADPLMTPDYHLQTGSPCVNAGDPDAPVDSPAMDVDGEPRVFDGRADMGCDEFIDVDVDGLPDHWEVACFGVVSASSAADDPDGDSWDNAQEYNRGGNPQFPSGICYVDPNHGDDSWDGLSATPDGRHGPKATIQAAIDHVGYRDEDEIVLLAGTYRGPGNRDIDFRGKATTVRGADPNDPDVIARTTIDCEGYSEEPHRAFCFASGETDRSRVAGIRVVGGWTHQNGGIIRCDIGSPVLSNCIFSQGHAAQRGGAICCDLYCSPTIWRCTLTNNTAQFGAGICSGNESSPCIGECCIETNSAQEGGGGIYTGDSGWQSGPTITGCRISGNHARYGGAVGCDRSNATIINCLVSGNTTVESGGAVSCWQATPSFTNCTIVDNYAGLFGGALVGDGSALGTSILFENCIIWGNSATDGHAIARTGCYMITGCPPVKVVFCCLQDDTGALVPRETYGWDIDWGQTCFSSDPCFMDWLGGDYRLRSDSPCIDVGINSSVHALPEMDIDGKPRILDGNADGYATVDLGAWEFQE